MKHIYAYPVHRSLDVGDGCVLSGAGFLSFIGLFLVGESFVLALLMMASFPFMWYVINRKRKSKQVLSLTEKKVIIYGNKSQTKEIDVSDFEHIEAEERIEYGKKYFTSITFTFKDETSFKQLDSLILPQVEKNKEARTVHIPFGNRPHLKPVLDWVEETKHFWHTPKTEEEESLQLEEDTKESRFDIDSILSEEKLLAEIEKDGWTDH